MSLTFAINYTLFCDSELVSDEPEVRCHDMELNLHCRAESQKKCGRRFGPRGILAALIFLNAAAFALGIT